MLTRLVLVSVMSMGAGAFEEVPGFFDGCNPKPATGGRINVSLVDSTTTDVKKVNVNVQRVELHGSGGWKTIGAPNKIIDLLTLQGGVSATLVHSTGIPVGHYTALRLILGEDGNTVELIDGSVVELSVPSAYKSGIKLPLSFDVAAGTTKDVFIDFDARNSLHLHQNGNQQRYKLRPVVKVFDKILTGSITGSISYANGGAAAGRLVMAESFDALGRPVLARTALTEADGSYMLDLLPVGQAYYVVTEAGAYAARASLALALSESSPTQSATLTLPAPSATGSLTATITPPSDDDEFDVVYVTQNLDAGGSTKNLIVVAAPAATVDGDERITLSPLATGTYAGRLVRSSVDAEGVTAAIGEASLPSAVVNASVNTSVTIVLE